MIRACVFDLDGTIVNSLRDLANSCNMALESCGMKTHQVEKYRYFVGDGLAKLMERIVPEDTGKEELAQMKERFDLFYSLHCFDYTKPYEGIPELLVHLREKGLKLMILTNKPHAFAQQIVNRLLPGHPFEIVQGVLPGMKKKPDTEKLLECVRTLGVAPEECVYIGDSGVDMETAVNAHMVAVGALWGFRNQEELSACNAEYLVKNPLALQKLIDRFCCRALVTA